MNVLKVLSLHVNSLLSQSLQLFTNLQSLYLASCNFTDFFSLGKLKRLEILSFYRCHMVALPNELGELQSLRLLDLMRCDRQKLIQQGLIQRLSSLEEVYIVKDNFKDWDDSKGQSYGSNVILSELSSLSRLIVLSFWRLKCLPEGFDFPYLQIYDISINSLYGYHIFTYIYW